MWKRIAIVGAFSVAVLYVTKRYFAGTKCRCQRRLDCKAVVITGATSGLGKALAFEVARRGAQVVLGCRDEEAARRVCEEVTAATGNDSVYCLPLDLTSLKSVHDFARRLKKCEYDVYALVNNAGVFYIPQRDTQNGFDETFQVNYLGGFLLTALLLDLLRKGAPSRVVNVSSQAHHLPRELAFLSQPPHSEFTKQLGLFDLYGQSKLCVNLFTRRLAQLVDGEGVTVVSVDPGNVETRIYRSFPLISNPVLYALQWPLRRLVVKTPSEGVQSVLHAVLAPALQGGAYIRECEVCTPSKLSMNEDLADRLFQRSIEWSGVDAKLINPASTQ